MDWRKFSWVSNALILSVLIVRLAQAVSYQNPVRLVKENISRPTLKEGTLEIMYNDTWRSVCDSRWGYSEAVVVCHMLGFSGAIRGYKR